MTSHFIMSFEKYDRKNVSYENKVSYLIEKLREVAYNVLWGQEFLDTHFWSNITPQS